MDWGMVFVVVFMCLILIGGLARLLWAMLDEPLQHSQKAPPSRHATILARIKEIEADALMDWDEWIVLEMAYREGRLQRPKSKRSGYGVTMDEAVQALSLMAGYGHQPTRTVDTSNPPKSGSAVIPPKQRDPYDMSGDYRALHWFDYERRTLAETRTILSLACQDEAHLHCHAIAQTGMRCRCECHRPNRQIMHLATQQPVDVSLACELGNCGECYYVDGAKHCACGCHEKLLEEYR